MMEGCPGILSKEPLFAPLLEARRERENLLRFNSGEYIYIYIYIYIYGFGAFSGPPRFGSLAKC